MNGRADLTSSIWITLGCTTVAGVGIAIWVIARFGAWSYPALADKLALAGFLVSAACLAGAVLGTLLFAGLWALDALGSAIGGRVVLTLFALATAGWLYGMFTRTAFEALSHPLLLALISVGFAACALLARGARPWRGGDVLVLSVTAFVLVGVGVWLNLVYIGVSTDPRSSRLNAVCLLGAQLVLAAAIALVGRGRRVLQTSRSQPKAPRWRALPTISLVALVALASASLAPLYSLAYDAGEKRLVANAPAGEIDAAAAGAAAREQPGGQPLDIVLISLDTLRADHMGLYGYPHATSPNLDRFFADKSVFTRMYAQGPFTLPTHMSMITGQYVSTHGARIPPGDSSLVDMLPQSATTVAEILRDRGYATGGFTGGAFVSKAYAFDQGFEVFEETHRIAAAVDQAIAWLEEREASADRPFFLFLHGMDVHMYDPPKLYAELSDEGYDGPLRGHEDMQRYADLDGFYALSEADLRYLQYLYDNELRGADEQLGRVFATLEREGLLDRTAVIFTSDHGEMFDEHGSTGHSWTLYETLLRVPLAISVPGLGRGRRISSPAQTVDLAPTIVELAGLAPGDFPSLQGRSLLPALRGDPMEKEIVISEGDALDTQAALVDDRFKYIHYGVTAHNLLDPRFAMLSLRGLVGPYGREAELFDLEADPGEQRNLAGHQPDLANRYREMLFERLEALRAAGSAEAESGVLSPELEERLRQLGYID